MTCRTWSARKWKSPTSPSCTWMMPPMRTKTSHTISRGTGPFMPNWSIPSPSVARGQAPETKQPNAQRIDRWLNYYGPHGKIPGISFDHALDVSDGAVRDLFRDRVVFVGSGTRTGFSGKRPDLFRTPYAALGEPLWPG